MFDVNCEFPLISMQKRCMGMYRDLWGCMGKHEDCREKIPVFCGKTKNFVWGVCGNIPMHYFLHGELPTQIFFAWGFVWGGFAWVCDTGVFGTLWHNSLRLR